MSSYDCNLFFYQILDFTFLDIQWRYSCEFGRKLRKKSKNLPLFIYDCLCCQAVCWVLGEYGTADGTHSADDIIGKLCDVVESHPSDNVVKVRVPLFSFVIHFLTHQHFGGVVAYTSFYCQLRYH